MCFPIYASHIWKFPCRGWFHPRQNPSAIGCHWPLNSSAGAIKQPGRLRTTRKASAGDRPSDAATSSIACHDAWRFPSCIARSSGLSAKMNMKFMVNQVNSWWIWLAAKEISLLVKVNGLKVKKNDSKRFLRPFLSDYLDPPNTSTKW